MTAVTMQVGPTSIDPNCTLQGCFTGSMSAAAARKVKKHLKLCNLFHLPVINFVDEPGFMIGPTAEKEATIRYG